MINNDTEKIKHLFKDALTQLVGRDKLLKQYYGQTF